MASPRLTPEQARAHWRKTSGLMWTIFVIWLIASFGVHFFAVQLNQIVIFGFPLGFYMAAQGSLIIFVLLCWWSSVSQNKIDEEFGVAED